MKFGWKVAWILGVGVVEEKGIARGVCGLQQAILEQTENRAGWERSLVGVYAAAQEEVHLQGFSGIIYVQSHVRRLTVEGGGTVEIRGETAGLETVRIVCERLKWRGGFFGRDVEIRARQVLLGHWRAGSEDGLFARHIFLEGLAEPVKKIESRGQVESQCLRLEGVREGVLLGDWTAERLEVVSGALSIAGRFRAGVTVLEGAHLEVGPLVGMGRSGRVPLSETSGFWSDAVKGQGEIKSRGSAVILGGKVDEDVKLRAEDQAWDGESRALWQGMCIVRDTLGTGQADLSKGRWMASGAAGGLEARGVGPLTAHQGLRNLESWVGTQMSLKGTEPWWVQLGAAWFGKAPARRFCEQGLGLRWQAPAVPGRRLRCNDRKVVNLEEFSGVLQDLEGVEELCIKRAGPLVLMGDAPNLKRLEIEGKSVVWSGQVRCQSAWLKVSAFHHWPGAMDWGAQKLVMQSMCHQSGPPGRRYYAHRAFQGIEMTRALESHPVLETIHRQLNTQGVALGQLEDGRSVWGRLVLAQGVASFAGQFEARYVETQGSLWGLGRFYAQDVFLEGGHLHCSPLWANFTVRYQTDSTRDHCPHNYRNHVVQGSAWLSGISSMVVGSLKGSEGSRFLNESSYVRLGGQRWRGSENCARGDPPKLSKL